MLYFTYPDATFLWPELMDTILTLRFPKLVIVYGTLQIYTKHVAWFFIILAI